MVKKRLFAAALAGMLAVSSVIPLSAQTITGTVWWDAGNQNLALGELTDGGTLVYEVKCIKGGSDGIGAFVSEVRDGDKCITTASDGNGWYYTDGGTTGDEPTGKADPQGSVIKTGETYTVTFTRSGNNVGVKYYDVTNNKIFADMKFNNTNLDSAAVYTNISAQVGTFDVREITTQLTGTEWWSGNKAGINNTIADNSTIEYEVACTNDKNGYAAFSVEIRDDVADAVHCITTSSDGNGNYYAEGGGTGDTPIGVENKGSVIKKDITYKVIVSRNGKNLGIQYFDDTNKEVFADMKFNNTNFEGNITVDFIAQVGTFNITQTNITGNKDVTDDVKTYAQYKKVADNDYTVRVISEISISDEEFANYNQIGFRCSNSASNAGDQYLGSNVYKTIKANGETETAAEGKYFVILEIKNVTQDATLYVQPIYESADGADILGNEVTVNMASILK